MPVREPQRKKKKGLKMERGEFGGTNRDEIEFYEDGRVRKRKHLNISLSSYKLLVFMSNTTPLPKS